MAGPRLFTLKPHRYGSRRYVPGDIYEAKTGRDARVMKALGWAGDVPADLAEVVPEPPKRRRTYRRRDLTAEGTE